jgi:hypothetical protein
MIQLDLHTIDVVTVDLIKWIKKARPGYRFGTDKEWDSLIQRVTGYRTEEGVNDILSSMEKRSTQSSRDTVPVYSYIIKPLVNFPCVTRRELALKDFENNDSGQSWTSLDFKLKIGDEIRVYRKSELHQKAGEHL